VTARQLIDQLFEEGEEPKAIFFATGKMPKFPDGFVSRDPDFQAQCDGLMDFLHGLNFFGATLDSLVAGGVVIIRRLGGHPRARFELISRAKKTRLKGDQVFKLQKILGITPDDVMLWRMNPSISGGELVYAGVAIFGESDIASRSPNYEPSTPKPKLKEEPNRLGKPRKLQRGRGWW
jgi:hypothetical protein